MMEKSITLLKEESIYTGFVSLTKLTIKQNLLNGGVQEIQRELMTRRDCIGLLPYDKNDNQVLLLQQFRPGAINDENGSFVTELVAGLIDDGESPLDAAFRELTEETGLVIENKNKDLLSYIGRFYLSPGACNEQVHLFLAEINLSNIDLSKGYGCKDEGEDIKLIKCSIDEAIDLTKNHSPSNITLLAALLELKLRLK